ncbi:MAG: hypothetical protein AAF580_04940 [Pseudomonadota bacterium]
MIDVKIEVFTKATLESSMPLTRDERIALLDAVLSHMSLNDILEWLSCGQYAGAVEGALQTRNNDAKLAEASDSG